MNILSQREGAERIFTPQTIDQPFRHETNGIGLGDIAQIIRRRFYLAGLITFLGTLLAVLAASVLEDRYTARATIVLEYNDTRLSDAASEFQSFNLNQTAIQTEMDVFRSRDFAGQIVDTLNLIQDPLFNTHISREPSSDMQSSPQLTNEPSASDGHIQYGIRYALEAVGLASPKEDAARFSEPAIEREKVISVLVSKVAVEQAGESLAITITVTHKDAVKTALIANAMVDKYVELSIKSKRDAANRAIAFLRQRASDLGSGVAAIERKLADHIRTHQLDDETLDASLHADIKKLKAQLQLFQKPRQAYSDFAPDQTRAQALKRQLKDLEKQLHERTLAQVRRAQLEREILTDSNRHTQVVERLANLDSKIEVLNPSARVVSRASTPIKPSYPQRGFIIFGGFAGFLILGIMVSILLEGLDLRIHSEEQLTALTGLPNLGVVPWVSLTSPFGRRLLHTSLTNKPHSCFSEGVRSFFFALSHVGINGNPKVVMLSSCWPGEGKSTLAVTLAVTAAMHGFRTALLDLDLRTRGASKSLMISNRGMGIESYLGGKCSLDEATRRNVAVEGLDVMPSVTQKDSPVRLLNTQRLAAMLDDLRKGYDFIVLDTPPAMLVNDPNVPGPLADAVVLVVRIGQTQTKAVKAAVKRFFWHKAPLAGTVLNGEMSPINKYGYRGKYGKYYEKIGA